MAARTEPAPGAVDIEEAAEAERADPSVHTGPPRWVAMAVVALLVASAGVWWAKRTADPRRLGDRGHVVAQVGNPCDTIHIETGGLVLTGQLYHADGSPGRPASWAHGEHIAGTLHLDRKEGRWVVRGTFTADDGTEVAVSGGIAGKVFFTASCAIGS